MTVLKGSKLRRYKLRKESILPEGNPLKILLTNDDGIYAPGIDALAKELVQLGDVSVFAPSVEQSGVSHSITYLSPLIVQDVYRGDRLFGRAVGGSPADCVKLAMLEFGNEPPDLVISGINSGANIGINVLYSGTVAAAIEGSFFGVTSVAVSLAMSEHPDFARAAKLAVQVIRQLLNSKVDTGSLWNLNLPVLTPDRPRGVKTLPMGLERYREIMERRIDPRGRTYYWSATDPRGGHPQQPDTDVEGIADGFITLTPLHFNLTHRPQLDKYKNQHWVING